MCSTDSRIRISDIERGAFHDGPGIRTVVFFAGCPLTCPWCCNPESRARGPRFLRDARRCIQCLACVENCPTGALDTQIVHNPELCTLCGRCAEVCPTGAISLSGREMTVRAILDEVLRDRDYYRESGGGLTLSGGEPFDQPDGALELLHAAKAEGLHTVVETTACAGRAALVASAAWVDLFYIDLKHAHAEKLARWTGASLEAYIKNVSALRDRGAQFVLRTPVIPGFNDTDAEMAAIFDLSRRLGDGRHVLLPYHALGSSKYAKLGLDYAMGSAKPPSRDDILRFQALGAVRGLDVEILM